MRRTADRPPIDKGVPLPPPPSLYPWRELEVGDSFFSRTMSPKSAKVIASKHSRMLGRRFVAHPEGDGVRIWRISEQEVRP